jgi:hypothetical protein
MKWIKVEDQLPTENKSVDIMLTNGTRKIGVMFDPMAGPLGKFFRWVRVSTVAEAKYYFTVTHWMYSPEPPTDLKGHVKSIRDTLSHLEGLLDVYPSETYQMVNNSRIALDILEENIDSKNQ